MAYEGASPKPVKVGGTGSTGFTAYAVICAGTSSANPLQNVSGLGTSGQILTSNGAGALPTWQVAPSSTGIVTIDGDTGSATGSTVTFTGVNAGKTIRFAASGATVDFNASDVANNTAIGNLAGNALSGGSSTVAIGVKALQAITSPVANTAVGYESGQNLSTGGFNSLFGNSAGSNYLGTESSNICVSNTGTTGESNVIRIGTQGSGTQQQNACYIAGINGITLTNPVFVVIDSVTGQLGVGSSGTSQWVEVTNPTQTMANNTGYVVNRTSQVLFTLPTNSTLGSTIEIIDKGGGGWKVQYGSGQQIIFNGFPSTVTSGSVTSTGVNDCIKMVCTTPSNTAPIFIINDSVGIIEVA